MTFLIVTRVLMHNGNAHSYESDHSSLLLQSKLKVYSEKLTPSTTNKHFDTFDDNKLCHAGCTKKTT